MRKMIAFTCLGLLVMACGHSGAERIVVASQQGNCVGVAPQKCLLIQDKSSDGWEFWYESIDGFNYEPGYEYVLEVHRETVEYPAADQSSVRLVLVKVISREQKTSEHMPRMETNQVRDSII